MVTGLMTKAEKVAGSGRLSFRLFFPLRCLFFFYLSNFYLILLKKRKEKEKTQSKSELTSSHFILQATGEQGKGWMFLLPVLILKSTDLSCLLFLITA